MKATARSCNYRSEDIAATRFVKSFSGTVPKGAGCSKHLSLLPFLQF